MKWFWPLSLRARVFAVLLLVVVGTNAAAAFFYYSFRDEAAAVGAATQAAEQIIVIRHMLERATTRQDQIELLQRLNSPVMRMTFNSQPLVQVSDRQLPSRIFLRALRREFPRDAEIRADSLFDDRAFENLPFMEAMDMVTDRDPHYPMGDYTNGAAPGAEAAGVPEDFSRNPRARPREGAPRDDGFLSRRTLQRLRSLGGTLPVADAAMFRVSVRPPNSTRWFNARIVLNIAEPYGLTAFPSWLAAVSVLIMGVALWGVGRATGPLSVFASAAERLGVDVNAEPLKEKGPPEVCRATRAFNTMQTRVKRYIQDRTQMLAAISHDLRTPITRLRLRAEFVDDDEQREKMMHDLNEMEAMIAETLVFARDDAAAEPASHIDVAAVVANLCGELRFSGREVTYTGPDSYEFLTRPLAFKRAVTNLVDNALKYGHGAAVTLAPTDTELVITIDDQGPGIPAHEMDRVFQPFVRLESSRSRETGGAGLGLTIARNAIRSMGGDVELANRDQGGLRVTVTLPAAGPRAKA
ncbi:MAG: ATP-binding protein [Rhodospirillaceae bacterium]